jgi:hypothetical protein
VSEPPAELPRPSEPWQLGARAALELAEIDPLADRDFIGVRAGRGELAVCR